MPKPELEFFPVDDLPWVPVPGAPPGHYQKILTEDPDMMFVTRMLKVDPGGRSTETFVHDFWRRSTSSKGVSGMVISSSRKECMPAALRA